MGNSWINGKSLYSINLQIMNNKQIMYDCDKGYVLDQQGPPGATCIGGLWRPTELPKCLLGQHPRLRWNRRRRRNVALSKAQKVHRFKEYLKQLAFNDLHGVENNYTNMDEYRLDPLEFLDDSPGRTKRNVQDIEEAYAKYYQKIQAKYRDYVANLLGARKNGGQVEDTYRNHLDQLRTSSRLDQHSETGDPRYTLKEGDLGYQSEYSHLFPDSLEEKPEPIISPISIPDITERLAQASNNYLLTHRVSPAHQYGPPLKQPHSEVLEEKPKDYEQARKQAEMEDFIAQLKSQTVKRRKKRDSKWHLDSIHLYQNDDSLDPYNVSKKAKLPKIPCEVS